MNAWVGRVGPLFIILIALAGLGLLTLTSVAGGEWAPYAQSHMYKALLAFLVFFICAALPAELWQQTGYLLHFFAILLLLVVEVIGETTKGAARWLDLGFFRLQPSEMVKITILLALAQLFSRLPQGEMMSKQVIALVLAIVLIPMVLILKQPDLGTALLVLFAALVALFVAGVDWRLFAAGGVLVVLSLPIGWMFLQPYQRSRVLTFLDPERDPLGAGYHILQSQTAIGSGEFWGRGWLGGTQSQLNFLPEKHTDFILSVFAEEFGLFGVLLVFFLIFLLIAYCFLMAHLSRQVFTQIMCVGMGSVMFSYIFVNAGMVSGLLPVVGVPIPFMSFGGTAMLTISVGFGCMISCHVGEVWAEPRGGNFQS